MNKHLSAEYSKNGYFVVRNLFDDFELAPLTSVLEKFHRCWKEDNTASYEGGAINSAYLTGTNYLSNQDSQIIFEFVASSKMARITEVAFDLSPCFLNTQLFFDPFDRSQENYWHRDPQYHLSIEEQKATLSRVNVVHVRIPLRKEQGIELVPGTHKRWDSEEELQIRLAKNGRKSSDDLLSGHTIELSRGDALVFSANMIHRGLYGHNRLAFDVMFSDPDSEVLKFSDERCLPDTEMMKKLAYPLAFKNTLAVKANSSHE